MREGAGVLDGSAYASQCLALLHGVVLPERITPRSRKHSVVSKATSAELFGDELHERTTVAFGEFNDVDSNARGDDFFDDFDTFEERSWSASEEDTVTARYVSYSSRTAHACVYKRQHCGCSRQEAPKRTPSSPDHTLPVCCTHLCLPLM